MRSLAFLAVAFAAAAPLLAAETIPVSEFRGVELRGGGSVVVRPGPVQRVILLSGSTQFTTITVEPEGRLRISACNHQCPRNYNLRIQIETPRVPGLAIAGGGEIEIAPGFAPQERVAAAVKGGGEINVRSVRAGNVSAAINGGGKVLAGNPATLTAAINGGGEVTYAGNPQITSAVRGGGELRRE